MQSMPSGLRSAVVKDVAAAKRIEELLAWQLGVSLRDQILALTREGKVARDFVFCDQIKESSSSVTANLAEGFGAFKPRVFAQYARIARRSLLETRDHLQNGKTRGYFTADDEERLRRLALRAQKATTRLIRYLDSCKGKAPTGWDFDAEGT